MSSIDKSRAPAAGDFAALVDAKVQQSREALSSPPVPEPGTTLEGVLLHGEEPTDAFVEEFAVLHAQAELSEEELALQALAHPGEDGDASTPE